MTLERKFRKVAQQWGKTALIAIVAMLISSAVNAQMKIAVLDFKAGAGVEQGDVDGISAIFGTYFIDPSKFTLVERTQIDRVISEQGFQYSTLTNQQMVKVGQILNIQRMVVGDVNIVSGQYNVDVRVVDVETGAINATDGATWARGTSYRELMRNLASQLMSKMTQPQVQTNPNQTIKQNSVVILYNYLKVYPEDLGTFSSYPHNIVKAIKDDVSYGYNTWRLPTEEELSLINNNRGKVQGMSSSEYMTIDGSYSGRVRLVTNRETLETREKIINEYQEKFPAEDMFNEKRISNYQDSVQVAIDYWSTFLSVHPKLQASLNVWVSQLLIEQKKYTEAVFYLKQALEIQPDYDEAFQWLGHIYYTDYEDYGNNQSYQLAIQYAKQGARFGNKACIDFCNYNNIKW